MSNGESTNDFCQLVNKQKKHNYKSEQLHQQLHQISASALEPEQICTKFSTKSATGLPPSVLTGANWQTTHGKLPWFAPPRSPPRQLEPITQPIHRRQDQSWIPQRQRQDLILLDLLRQHHPLILFSFQQKKYMLMEINHASLGTKFVSQSN
jgi:hypothetical protein